MEESQISETDNTSRQVIYTEIQPISPCSQFRGQNNNNDIKCEEFDVDEFLSNENNDFACPSSPDSEPVSPSNPTIVEIDSSFKMYNATTESGVVEKPTNEGYRMIQQAGNFIDDEFLLSSCAANDELNNACDITDVDDPFSELFPSLLSV